MSPKKLYSFKIDSEVATALKHIKAREGIGESEQIRRGILLWLETKGITPPKIKADRRRPASRKRSSTRKRR